jgi:hypothetical protein
MISICFVPLEKQQTGKRFATDADVKQAVSTWRSDMYGLLPVSHVCVEVKSKGLGTIMYVALCICCFMYMFPEISLQVKFLVSCAI